MKLLFDHHSCGLHLIVVSEFRTHIQNEVLIFLREQNYKIFFLFLIFMNIYEVQIEKGRNDSFFSFLL
jgi:hypothetical protein